VYRERKSKRANYFKKVRLLSPNCLLRRRANPREEEEEEEKGKLESK
jgi:hypothetical protein